MKGEDKKREELSVLVGREDDVMNDSEIIDRYREKAKKTLGDGEAADDETKVRRRKERVSRRRTGAHIVSSHAALFGNAYRSSSYLRRS